MSSQLHVFYLFLFTILFSCSVICDPQLYFSTGIDLLMALLLSQTTSIKMLKLCISYFPSKLIIDYIFLNIIKNIEFIATGHVGCGRSVDIDISPICPFLTA